jgi:DNA helicase-2/ATP-dependent DNA helicase PcrA
MNLDLDLDLPSPTPPALSDRCTPEQLACINFIHQQTGHLVIDSVAGSGKTFTLVEIGVAINHYFPLASIAYVMFNSKNVPEMEDRITRRGVLKATVGTVHKFGFAAYKNEHGPCQVNRDKATDVAERLNKQYKFLFEDVVSVCRMVSLAKDTGLGLDKSGISTDDWINIGKEYDILFKQEDISITKVCNFAGQLYNETIEDTNSVDFSDMIALPLYHSYPFRQYDFVLVDEAQDINRCRLLAIIQMLKPKSKRFVSPNPELDDEMILPGGRLIAVGDRHQSIYAFTGADSKSLDNIKRHFSAHELSLTTCFRCDKAIIRHVNHLVPHIRPRAEAGDGIVNSLTYDKFEELLFVGPPCDLQSHAILCRKNAPLMRLAFRLSARGTKCRMEGRDIGKSLIYFAKKFEPNTPGELGVSLSQHLREQAQKLSPRALATLQDKIECLLVGCQHATSIKSLFQYIKSIFSDSTSTRTSTLTLCSVHKSKGLEWPTVYILGENLWMPSPLAKTKTALEQENNLIYVARTRAMHTLTSITMDA